MLVYPLRTMTERADIVIVGAGIAGMYTALRLRHRRPRATIVLLEADATVGGRAGEATFAGVKVPIGAGVGRLRKDKRLLALLDALGVAYEPFRMRKSYAASLSPASLPNVKDTVIKLRDAYLKQAIRRPTTFRAFASHQLGRRGYKAFTAAASYTDYESADAWDTLSNYGMNDNAAGWMAVHLEWNALTSALARAVGRSHIRMSSPVTAIEATADGHRIHYQRPAGERAVLDADMVVVATALPSLQRLFPNHIPYKHIIAQPFMRLYVQLDVAARAAVAAAVPHLTAVPAPLQKLVPMDHAAGVYMIYADNASALALNAIKEDYVAIARLLEAALGFSSHSIGILQTQPHFWQAGTHAFAPLPRPFADRRAFIRAAQHPVPGILVVGEVVAQHQGWTEGALTSVELALRGQ
jgi:monoamine oxidase